MLGVPYHVANDEAPGAPIRDSSNEAFALAYFMSIGPYLHICYTKSGDRDRSFSVRKSLCIVGKIEEDEAGTERPDDGCNLRLVSVVSPSSASTRHTSSTMNNRRHPRRPLAPLEPTSNRPG